MRNFLTSQTNINKFNRRPLLNAGFTLVELAIVIVIIGLLVGGVLQGQELIKQSRIVSTATQINSYLAALTTFKGKYGTWPGDFRQASTMINISTGDGDGDGKIMSSYVSSPPLCLQSGAKNGATDTEISLVWKHLSLANLIKFQVITGTSTLSDNFPAYELAKGTQILANCYDTGDTSLGGQAQGTLIGAGHIFILGVATETNTGSVGANTANTRIRYMLPSVPSNGGNNVGPQGSAVDLYSLDKKLDDGIPNTGVIKVLAGCDYNLSAYTIANDNCKSTLSYKWD